MNFSKLKFFLDKKLEEGLPMYDCTVMRDHKVLTRLMGGWSDIGKTRPIKGDEQYWMFSCTKPVTCTATMKLVERGQLGLDDKLSDYIPEFADVTVKGEDGREYPAKKPILIRHLFTMTSGIDYDFCAPPCMQARADKNASTHDIVVSFAKHPLLFEPGTRWQYGLSHDVLAAVIEAVSGMSFFEYLNKNLFSPLGMKHTVFHPNGKQLEAMAQKYTFEDGNVCDGGKDNPYMLSDRYESGGAGLLSRLDDYRLFADAMACGGVSENGARILTRESIDMMRESRLAPCQMQNYWKSGEYNYGLGVYTLAEANDSGVPKGVFGWDGAAGAFVMIDVENHISISAVTHLLNWGAIIQYEKMRDLIYECLTN